MPGKSCFQGLNLSFSVPISLFFYSILGKAPVVVFVKREEVLSILFYEEALCVHKKRSANKQSREAKETEHNI